MYKKHDFRWKFLDSGERAQTKFYVDSPGTAKDLRFKYTDLGGTTKPALIHTFKILADCVDA